MKNIAIIPARSGSKGLVNKNVKEINGIPLLAYSIKAAKESGLFCEVMVSTDSELYAEIAISYGATVPFLRDAETSGDKASSWAVVEEVLTRYKQNNQYYDTVCLLQPTSPLRTALDINKAYKLLEEKQADAISSVCEVDHSPLWCMTLPESLSLYEFRMKNKGNKPRQDLGNYYRLNGAIYIRTIDYTRETICINDKREYAYIMDKRSSIDIDTMEDFEMAEIYINKLKRG